MSKKHVELLLKEVVDYGNCGLRVIALASADDVGSNPLLKKAKTTEAGRDRLKEALPELHFPDIE